jgi:RNA polymerase sigma factor (sigma-70 family)
VETASDPAPDVQSAPAGQAQPAGHRSAAPAARLGSPKSGEAGLAGETDADLLIYMSLAADDAAVARAAWAELYHRHAEYLYGVCLRAYGPLLGGQAGACDLVADTFRRAYEHADTFDAHGIQDPDRLRLRVRAWLGRIAQRLLQTRLRGRRKLPTRLLQHEHWQEIAQPRQPQARNLEEIERVRSAVLSLSEREQMVLRVTFQWYQPDRAHQRLPNEVAADLARALQTTPENLRQIRRRALRKIRAVLAEHGGRDGPRRPNR